MPLTIVAGCRSLLSLVAAVSLVLQPAPPPRPAAGWRARSGAETAQNGSLAQFHQTLKAAVRARDLQALTTLASWDVAVADEERGFANLVEVYELNDRQSIYWVDLETVLSFDGMMVSDGVYCVPQTLCTTRAEDRDVMLASSDPMSGPGMYVLIARRDGRWQLVKFASVTAA